MIILNKQPGQKVLELGGGDHPHPEADCNVDVRSGPKVHFTADFNEPLPINSDEWDGVFCQFAIEHISWRKVPQFIAEIFRVLKPGGKAVIVTANTQAQMKYIEEHPDGWEDRGRFVSASITLFGDLDYPENSHKAYFDPLVVNDLFGKAGFTDIKVHPYGAIETDMVIEASKPGTPTTHMERVTKEEFLPGSPPNPVPKPLNNADLTTEERASLFGFGYWDNYTGPGQFVWDYPTNVVIAKNVLARRPESVLELGCGRGYVLKRLQDVGVKAHGIDISKYCQMTRVADNFHHGDLCYDWERIISADRGSRTGVDSRYDLCLALSTLEHIPEPQLPSVIKEMVRTCRRGLVAIESSRGDRTRCTIKSVSWWVEQFGLHAPGWSVEVVERDTLQQGDNPEHVQDGKLKLNLGSHLTMFHRGWVNVDLPDLNAFAHQYGYIYRQHDLRTGLPVGTETVDLIYSSHCIEHLTYAEGLALFKEMRRAIKPDGAVRIIVPDTETLVKMYQHREIGDLDEVNPECAKASSPAGKLTTLLWGGDHKALYDGETLCGLLREAGFNAADVRFRTTLGSPAGHQILRETLDMLPCLSLYVEATPVTG